MIEWYISDGTTPINLVKEAVVAGVCEVCGKTKSFGHNVSHSKRRTNRDFRANIQRKRIVVNGSLVRVDICTRCMRTANKSVR